MTNVRNKFLLLSIIASVISRKIFQFNDTLYNFQ